MIVTELQLSHLRAIEAAEFKFRAGFNLIVGVNGVGKTTVLDALRICLSRVLPKIAEVRAKPNIKNKGPSSPPKNTTAASHGISGRCKGASTDARPSIGRPQCTKANPVPAPRYRMPASNQGSIAPINSFDSGADAPNNTAAPRANGTPGQR